MCLGAIVVARIGHVRLGAIDPTWLGIERLPDLNDEVQHRWPQIPQSARLPGTVAQALEDAWDLFTDRSGALRYTDDERCAGGQ
jgi:hypothetical protein